MLDRFMEIFEPQPHHRVLDLGVTPDTSLVESNFFEALYPYPGQITAVSIEDVAQLGRVFPKVRFMQVGTEGLPFQDDEFDFVFCSAVLEHVGARDQQRRFVAEALRVAGGFFFTTPNRWFPLEFHTLLPLIHWLPQGIHQRLLRLLGHDFLARTENLNLLGSADVLDCFRGARQLTLERHRLLGMTSNLMVYGRK